MIVLGFLSVVIWHLRPNSTAHRPKVVFSSKINVLPSFMPAVKGARAVTFTGTHDMGGMHFVTNGGLLVIHAQCTCQYNFVVTISNASNVPIAFPINDTGRVNSVLNTTVAPGPIILSVVGQGRWVVQLVQPVATTPALPTPFTYLSEGNDVIGPFSAANKYLYFQFLSSDGAVDVRVLSEQGFGLQVPFTGRIALSSSKVLASLPSRYFLEVDSTSGLWNLDVRRTPKPKP